MLKMVDGSGIIGVDMICPLGISTPQPPNYDRVELEGTGMLVLPNSLDAPLERLELGGKTGQVQTTGAQLFEASRYEGVTKNGVTVTVKDGVITATGTPNINTWIQVFVSIENYQKLFKPENKIYLKTNKSKDCNYDFGIYGAFGSPIIGTIREGNSGRALPAELPRNDTDFYFFIDVKIGTELKGSIKPIVYHDGDGTWEPYTGGKPSPSPEYQQEIKNVGKWNEETQKYEVDVKITGKNLLNTYEKAEKDSEFYSVNGDGSLNQKKVDNRSFLTVPETLFLRAGKYYFSLFDTGVTFQLYNADANKVLLVIEKQESVLVDLEKDTNIKYKVFNSSGTANNVRVMVSINKETDYVPYKEPQTLTLTSDRPLTKWDRLVEQGGEIGWLYNSKIDDDVKASRTDLFPYGFSLYKNQENGTYTYKSTNIKKAIGFQTSYCKQFRNKDAAYQSAELWHYSDQPSMKIQYFNTDIATVEEFIEWMESDPLTMVFKTESATFAPLPQSEQNAIRALKTYYHTTVITADGGELDPDIKVTYRKEK